MTEHEVIIVDGIPSEDYHALIGECVKYAIISLPFTVDRMSIPNPQQRALNIAKGKIAEKLLGFFCSHNGISIDFETCSTPFWTVDNRDFILRGTEWDIKNNFYYSKNGLEPAYTNLPALVPNRFSGDQWSKRNTNLIAGTQGVEFLFTFLKGASLDSNGRRYGDFLDLHFSESQVNYIQSLYRNYLGQPQNHCPYSEVDFWTQFDSLSDGHDLFSLNNEPPLIITAYANNEHWSVFKDTGGFDRYNNWQDYIMPRWYSKTQKGSLNFFNGTLWTTITNATVPVSLLPSFLSLYPHLKTNIKYGRIK